MKKFINRTDFEFVNISTEEYRSYTFPGGHCVTLAKPLHLHVSKSGGHRVFTADGISHYIPTGWIHLHWEAKKGQANFVA